MDLEETMGHMYTHFKEIVFSLEKSLDKAIA